ncbi:tumor susceptibility 101 [Thecamonas trahens ATCC 50062]|uniref:Tumor susceptibility 101 n=1 Tax=Thecamonas trahens ATCC 50062 TaxID=461836 RepID=A0A0L0DTE2_THETB|nr:tumor susceptibility 101 [Thecamonas trahens ATCC 50062]KNC55492.1 tumor susceptibility 101 [Thecamonas trahens ATCC 50062]|eukprot:XP_013761272.1 tumor susceptibility 101 [Thecamonas trahens ATCC 50062]
MSTTLDVCLSQVFYHYRDRTRGDVQTVMRTYPGLSPEVATYTSNTGAEETLLALTGTIPITYAGNTYNIPVKIWLPSVYPSERPIAFVTPTTTMYIKPGHDHVDLSGRCYLPYLTSWTGTNSSLIGLVAAMCSAFSACPPVASGPPPTATPVMASPPAWGAAPGYTTQSSSSTRAAPAYTDTSPPGYTPAQDPVVMVRKQLAKELTEKTQASLREFFPQATAEVDSLYEIQRKRTREAAMYKHETARFESERDHLAAEQEQLMVESAKIESWVEANQRDDRDVDIDEMTKPKGVLNRQLLDAMAKDRAIDDLLYALSRALNDGVILLAVYLKQVRKLSRDQFLARALAERIKAKINTGIYHA